MVPFTPDQLEAMDRDTVFSLYIRPKTPDAKPLSPREIFFKHGREVLKRSEIEIEADWRAMQERMRKRQAAQVERIKASRETRLQRARTVSARKRK